LSALRLVGCRPNQVVLLADVGGILHSSAMSTADSRLVPNWSPSPLRGTARFVRLRHLRRLRGSEQVAAVCYRVRNGTLEFLLVRTRAGRWIFPKGNAEAGLTHAQAAALEAFEEAGVHGRMEEAPFSRYTHRKGGSEPAAAVSVSAYLCEVSWLESPRELDRDPTWFSPDKAKRRLREDRPREYGNDLARVVDSAIGRIQSVHRGASTLIDSQQTIQFIDAPRRVRGSRKGS
jgi:8-oxo-dGTP pyrophosphatase MutT (NUDIX family)